MIEVIRYKEKEYPLFQSKGNAAQFAIPFAKHFCKGFGYDVGCNRLEWAFPGSYPIDPVIDNRYHALNFPEMKPDYIFSSHCLEHIPNYIEAMDYWYYRLVSGGVLFLYLPDFSQVYWRPWNNRKHLHIFTPDIIREMMSHLGYHKIFVSEVDLMNSFMAVGEK